MLNSPAEVLRKAIENLINAKLHDVLSHRDGLSRLAAHRNSWVASDDVRNAEKRLEQVISDLLPRGKKERIHAEMGRDCSASCLTEF